MLTPYIMNSDDAVEVGNDSSRMGRIVSEWYALNPDIRRVWVYKAGKNRSRPCGRYPCHRRPLASIRQRWHQSDLVSEMHWLAETPAKAHRAQRTPWLVWQRHWGGAMRGSPGTRARLSGEHCLARL